MTRQQMTIIWTESEWSDKPEAQSTYFEGFIADVIPYSDGLRRKFQFWVKATAEVSEWPELQAFGDGFLKPETAKRAAEKELRKAARLNKGKRVEYG